ncbi:MAG: hypothetical protein BWY82_02849 [Verrucomicrobia bacterium ADurb.Bin474]|nr:MAG: hypothetical protein BWY82_02849 [Verrucomicrobia bacterium ADurb.Bin474]
MRLPFFRTLGAFDHADEAPVFRLEQCFCDGFAYLVVSVLILIIESLVFIDEMESRIIWEILLCPSDQITLVQKHDRDLSLIVSN